MKKQFLLGLMAMLLPLAAWAQTDISDAIVTFASKTYQGDVTKAPDVTSVKVGDATLTPDDYTVETTYYTDATCSEEKKIHDAGTYYVKVKAQGDGYTGTAIASFTIKKAVLMLGVANMEKVYGTPDEEVDFKYAVTNGYKDGDDEDNVIITGLTLSREDKSENVGTYAATLKGGVADNYEITVQGSALLTITKATLTVKADDASKTYGDVDPELTATFTGIADLDNAESLNLQLSREEGEDVGSYDITATASSDNYDITVEGGNFTINKAQLTVTATDATKVYGEKDPDFTTEATIGEFKRSDTAESIGLTLTRENAEKEDVGEYKIILAENEFTNYEIIYANENAKLTITAKSLASEDIKVTISEETYTGQDIEPTITVKDGEKDLAVDTDYKVNYLGDHKNASDAVQVTIAGNGNYSGNSTTETFVIKKAKLTVTAKDCSKQYGAEDPQFEVEYNGFVNDETKEVLEGELTFTREEGDGQGTYKITPAGLTAQNYDIEFVDGTLTIGYATAITLDRNATGDQAVSKLLADNDGATNITVTLGGNRSLNANYWYAMVLPFETTVRKISNAFGYAVVDVPNTDNTDPDEIAFKLHMGIVPANTLFLFKIDEATNLNDNHVKFEGCTIDYDPNYFVTDAAGNEYHGVYEEYRTTDAADWYLTQNTFRNAGVYYETYGSEVIVSTLAGYVKAVAGSAARIIVEEPDGSTTAINAVIGETINNAEGWYSIDGVKLNAQPTQKGIYINNGKKVVIK